MVKTEYPWTSGGLVLKKATLLAVEEDAVACYARDEEACGYLVGPAAEPLLCDGHVRMQNRANKLHAMDPEAYPRTGRMYFDFDSLKLQKAVAQGARDGRPVKVFYHSHLDVGSYFSDTDAAAMKGMGAEPEWPVAFLVTSVRGGPPRVDDHRLFIWDGASFAPSTFLILD